MRRLKPCITYIFNKTETYVSSYDHCNIFLSVSNLYTLLAYVSTRQKLTCIHNKTLLVRCNTSDKQPRSGYLDKKNLAFRQKCILKANQIFMPDEHGRATDSITG